MRRLFISILVILTGILIYSCGTESTPTYTVTISSSPAQAGSIELSPSGGTYDEGTEVTATAAPNEGWAFRDWSGTVSSTQNPFTFTVDQDINLIGVFTKKTYPLNIEVEGEGSVTEQIVSSKNKEYEHGTVVELTPEPDEGWIFVKWGGDLDGSETPIQITVDEEKSVTATFEKLFFLAENDVTIKCPKASPGDKGTVNGVEYEAVDRELLIQRRDEDADLTRVCTSLVTDMEEIFFDSEFNQPIGNWDVSNVGDMSGMFEDSPFNQPIGNWDVSSVFTMTSMFEGSSFNQPVGDWDVSNVGFMTKMFFGTPFNHPLQDWDVASATDMFGMFEESSFNEPIGNWDVSSVENMRRMFSESPFNQPIGDWDVSSVNDMAFMFDDTPFNQTIGNWDVGNVTTMQRMFEGSPFNQSIGSWDVSSVENMNLMFAGTPFNQPVNEWNVSSVINLSYMFSDTPFNQPLNDWDVSNVTNMAGLFEESEFNQTIGDWDVSSVTNMKFMFFESEFNQDISGWCVSQISDEPDQFAANSPLTEQNKPDWGTCPNN